MKNLLLIALFLGTAHAQEGSESIYKFNYINTESQKTEANSIVTQAPEAAPKTTEGSYFSQNLLNSPDKFYKVLFTFMTPVSRQDSLQKSNSLAANLLFTSQLWGVKVIREEYNDDSSDEMNTSFSDIKAWKFGANKLFPVSNFIAIETAAFYEIGTLTYVNTYVLEENSSYKSGNFHLGVNFYSGNFLAGIQYQQRFLVSAPTEEGVNLLKNKNLILANVGVYF